MKMKNIALAMGILALVLSLFLRCADAQDSCSARVLKGVEARSNRYPRYCKPFSVNFPWGTCHTRVCWKGSRAWPVSISGVTCGVRTWCVQNEARGPHYTCWYS